MSFFEPLPPPPEPPEQPPQPPGRRGRESHEFHRLTDDVRFADGRKATNLGRRPAQQEKRTGARFDAPRRAQVDVLWQKDAEPAGGGWISSSQVSQRVEPR